MTKSTLYIRRKAGDFVKAKSYSSYRLAVEAGQDLGGYGNFYVETGNLAPSREEQLLEEPKLPRLKARELALTLD